METVTAELRVFYKHYQSTHIYNEHTLKFVVDASDFPFQDLNELMFKIETTLNEHLPQHRFHAAIGIKHEPLPTQLHEVQEGPAD